MPAKEERWDERDKSALMARIGLSEDEAFRALQKASMDNAAWSTLPKPRFR
ncbi:ANTAR domain-containing protein [Cupriavidus sp. L7L]|uniref:ANTAR domain-containing protein n=1 Tax=Cupriavidus sp. L7L TaxID=2546443 RepID=UPI001FB7EE50|nr:ANTAR domain-containing protein [Cupriavidus sp. L7L]